MEKRKKLQAKIVSASNDKFVIRIGDISKTPKVGDSLVVTIPSRAKVEMVRKTNSLSGVRITDTIARRKVIGVNEGVVTIIIKNAKSIPPLTTSWCNDNAKEMAIIFCTKYERFISLDID